MPIQPPDVMDDPQEPKEQPEVSLVCITIAIPVRRPSGKTRNRYRRTTRKRRRRRLIVIYNSSNLLS